jgi:hypothetical protein
MVAIFIFFWCFCFWFGATEGTLAMSPSTLRIPYSSWDSGSTKSFMEFSKHSKETLDSFSDKTTQDSVRHLQTPQKRTPSHTSTYWGEGFSLLTP